MGKFTVISFRQVSGHNTKQERATEKCSSLQLNWRYLGCKLSLFHHGQIGSGWSGPRYLRHQSFILKMFNDLVFASASLNLWKCLSYLPAITINIALIILWSCQTSIKSWPTYKICKFLHNESVCKCFCNLIQDTIECFWQKHCKFINRQMAGSLSRCQLPLQEVLHLKHSFKTAHRLFKAKATLF